MVVEDHKDKEAKGVGPDHLEGMEQWDRWDLLDEGDSQEGMDYPPLGTHSLPWDWEYPCSSPCSFPMLPSILPSRNFILCGLRHPADPCGAPRVAVEEEF